MKMLKILEFDDLREAIFLKRLNRFLLIAKYGDSKIQCHIHDPGRLGELLIPSVRILIQFKKGARKTPCDLVAVNKDGEWIFTHSGYHSKISLRLIKSGLIREFEDFEEIIREYKIGKSRIDFLLKKGERKFLLEVKGCTLFRDGIGYFPDAPTERGRRHLMELMKAIDEGFEAGVLFLVMGRDIRELRPNWRIDPRFSEAMIRAYKKGVKMIAYTFYFDGKALFAVSQIPVKLIKE